MKGVNNMYVLVVVLNAIDYLEDLLSSFVDEGISGATILESQGMGRAIVENEHSKIPLFGALKSVLEDAHPYSKTVFTVLEDEEMVDKAVKAVQKIISEQSLEGAGFMFTIPIGKVYPMKE